VALAWRGAGVWLPRPTESWIRQLALDLTALGSAGCTLLPAFQPGLLSPRDPEALQSWRPPGSRVLAAPDPSARSRGELGAWGAGAGGLAQGGGLVSLVERCRVPSWGSGCSQHCVHPGRKSAGSRWSCGVEERWSEMLKLTAARGFSSSVPETP